MTPLPHCESQELLELGGPTGMNVILPTLPRAQRQERTAAGPALSTSSACVLSLNSFQMQEKSESHRLYVLLIPMLRTLDPFWLRTLTFDSRKLIELRPFLSYSCTKLRFLGTNLLGDDLAAEAGICSMSHKQNQRT